MMARIDLSEFDGIRRPTPDETYKITRYYEHLYGRNGRTNRILGKVFIVLGFVFICGYMVSGAASIVFGVIFFAIAFGFIKGKNEAKADLNVFRSGDFIVIPGSVCEIKTDTTGMLGVSVVRFISHGGKKLDAQFEVRRTQLQMGTPLLLIHVDEDKIRHGLTRVFTPFMLTEEGLEGTLF
ncbi:MAG: hypothetical protein LUI87_13980 [Lachnospiraceae bacterium]|nr:hypothetical protein [Lachnospiraceae bacterium]